MRNITTSKAIRTPELAPRERLFARTLWAQIEVQFLRFALVLAFVPSVSFSLTSFDTQPFAAILGIVCIMLAASSRLPVIVWYLTLPAFAALVIATMSSTLEVGARSFVIYASPWIFACTAYLASQRKIEISKYIIFMIYLWAAVGLVQWLTDPRIFEFLVNTRTTDARGVTSLAPEPSFYGLTIIQLWLTLLLVQPRSALKGHVAFLCIFQIFILAKAMVAILVAVALFFIFTLRSAFWFVAGSVGFCALLAIVETGGDGASRVFALIDIVRSDPFQILYLDASISERFYHLFLSLKEAISSGLMPHGFDAFAEVIVRGKNQYDSYWWGEAENKIMSGFGSAVFELGWFSLIYLFVFYSCLSQYQSDFRVHKFAVGIGIFFVLLNSVTFAAPCFGLMIGIMAARNNVRADLKPRLFLTDSPKSV